MSLRIYNTLTRRKDLFEPAEPGKVGIYLCGPTVYKPSHIGHAVGPVIFDAVKRYLINKGFDVTLVVNITDVDDKLIAEADAQGRPMEEIAREVEANYKACMERLNVEIDEYPRATENIAQIVELVGRLIEQGAAYAVDGDVYFDHAAAVDYGKLSGRRLEEQLSGTRELAGKARHPADFAVWKAAEEGQPGWESPWGRGRPGWHIECSAMAMARLGETLDIHGGGMDLIFPHHENEIAQSETATGKPFARYWMHNGLTRSRTKATAGEWKNEKMSKSLGNIRQIDELLDEYGGELLRAFVLGTHYRRPLEFSDEQLTATARSLETFYRLFERVERVTGSDAYGDGVDIVRMHGEAPTDADRAFVDEVVRLRLSFYEAMDDDFNTANAFAALHNMAAAVNRYIDSAGLETAEVGAGDDEQLALDARKRLAAAAGVTLVRTGRIVGLFLAPPERPAGGEGPDDAEIDRLVAERTEARKARDFARADAIRDQLAEMGITLEDTPSGVVWRRA